MNYVRSVLCALLVAVVVTAFVGAFEARACSVCMAGDPYFDANGATAQQVGHRRAEALQHAELGVKVQHLEAVRRAHVTLLPAF